MADEPIPPRTNSRTSRTWRVTVSFSSVLFGLLAGLGASLLIQQLGWAPFSLTTLWLLLVGGALTAILFESLGYALSSSTAPKQASSDREGERA